MEPYVGQIQPFGFNFPPRGWAQCDGQLFSVSQNDALFSLLGTIYGGDGRTTFGLPDLRGRAPIHYGQGPGLSDYQIGSDGGAEHVTLSVNQIPSHSHTVSGSINANATSGESAGAVGNYTATNAKEENFNESSNSNSASDAVSVSLSNAGSSQQHYNVQPFQAVNFCIALFGTYPSRS